LCGAIKVVCGVANRRTAKAITWLVRAAGAGEE